MSAHLNGKLIYDKRGKFIQWGKDSLNKQLWENCKAICKGMKLEKIFLSLTKRNSKCIKGLSIRLKTIKLLEINIYRALFDINHSILGGMYFLKQRK